MNLLYLCHRIPYPPDKGDKIRSFHQIEHLARTHAVHLACLVDRPEDLAFAAPLAERCASVDVEAVGGLAGPLAAAFALPTSRPLSVAAFDSRALRRRVRARLRSGSIDAIVAFSAAMADYVLDRPDLPRVLDLVDVDSEKWRSYGEHHRFPVSWLYRLEADRLARYEARVSDLFDESLLVTQAEADLFRQRAGPRRVTVIPNGVDTAYFRPADQPAETPSIVFVGAMDYFPNIDAVGYFCDRVFPRIRESIPEARFTIVGRHPSREVRRLAGRPHVEVTGGVPDVRPYLRGAALSVAPFRIARGVQNKILESMAAGLPVVGTGVALQGIEAGEGDGVRLADDPEALAQAVITILRDGDLRLRCGAAARRYVERRHSWPEHGAALEASIARAIERARRRADERGTPAPPDGMKPAAARGAR